MPCTDFFMASMTPVTTNTHLHTWACGRYTDRRRYEPDEPLKPVLVGIFCPSIVKTLNNSHQLFLKLRGCCILEQSHCVVACVNECVGVCAGAVAEAPVSLPGVSGAGH